MAWSCMSTTSRRRFSSYARAVAGEILQKFVNYGVKLAIVGDFSRYDSKALADFIYESNQGRHFFFAATHAEALSRLAGAR